MVKFELIEKEMRNLVKVTLENDSVRTEAGAMYYMKGPIEMTSTQMGGVGGMFKSMLSGESIVRPVYEGTGELYLEPSYGVFTIFDLEGEEWILDKGAYYASEMSVEVGVFTNKAISGMFSGEGFFQTKVSGSGKVVVSSQGPLETVELNNDKLVVDGKFAVARTGNLEYRVQKASKGLFSTVISGEGLVNTFTGTGKVLLAPVAHRFSYLEGQFGSIMTALSSQKK